MILRISNQPELQPPPLCAIAATAEARFRSSSYRALRGIACKAERGVLVLEGRLSSFFQKQMAQELVAKIEGVIQVVNHIEVVSSNQNRSDDNSASR